jgi:hypothetical protein
MGLTNTYNNRPVSCRFYFRYDITTPTSRSRRGCSRSTSHNPTVLTAQTETEVAAVPGVDGRSAPNPLLGPDGASDWAAVFVKGHTLVVVRTDQTDATQDAVAVVNAIIGRF